MKIERINKTFIITVYGMKYVLWRFAIVATPFALLDAFIEGVQALTNVCELIDRHYAPKLRKWAMYKQKGYVVT